MVVQANHVNIHNEQNGGAVVTDEIRTEFETFWHEHADKPLEGRNHIIASVCPQIFGCYAVKLAVTLVLIGGVRRVDQSGTKVRGESHLLLVGDPGKSRLHKRPTHGLDIAQVKRAPVKPSSCQLANFPRAARES